MGRFRRDHGFALALDHAIKCSGKSRDAVVLHCSVTHQALSAWTRGKAEPTERNFNKLVELFPELDAFRGKP